jgi:hypothetical protein
VWALLTLWRHAIERALGLHRPFRHKLLPALALVIAFLPAIASVGIAVLLPTDLLEEDLLVSYGEYYGFIATALALFAAFVAPEALCTDRRTGMLGLYLAGPLDRHRYLVAKAGSVLAVVLVMTVLPQLFLLAAYAVEDAGPSPGETPELLARILVAGIAVSALYTSVSMGIASLTAKRAVAAVAIVLLLVTSAIASGIATESAGAPDLTALVSLPTVPAELARRILADPPTGDAAIDRLSTGALAAGLAAWIALGAAVCVAAYRRIEAQQ